MSETKILNVTLQSLLDPENKILTEKLTSHFIWTKALH